MNNVPIEKVRNIVLLGHAASGKTTLVEAMLLATGAIGRLGAIDAKNTVSDTSPEEHERQCSIHSSNLFVSHRDHNIFVADTPGYIDFYGEVVASAAIADAGVITVDAAHGIELGTQKVWQLLDQKSTPRMVVLTKMDRENTDFSATMAALEETFGNSCVALQVPVGQADSFNGVVDIIAGDAGEADTDVFDTCRTKLLDAVAETDEALMEKYFGDEELTRDEIVTALHAGVAKGEIVPVVLCSATTDVGVKEALDCIVDNLPSPSDRGERPVAEGDPLTPDAALPAAAQVFKTVTDPFVGQITYLRVYQGSISSSSEVQNVTRNHKERVGELLIIQGKEQIHVDTATPGDVIAIPKLKDTHVNDTLGAAKVTFEPIEFPRPVMTLSVQSANQGDEEKLAQGLHRMAEEDMTIVVERHAETHEQLVSGMGDVHLDVAFKRLQDKFKVQVTTAIPKVAYHETIRGTADVRYRHKKQSGGAGQFAEVAIRLKPNERDAGYEFVDKIVGGVISNQFIPSVDKGIKARMKDGIMAGCPVVDLVVELYDGKEHPVDSKDIAFQIAGRQAIAEAVEKANPILLEPIMDVEVHCPQRFMGDINGIINSKRGRIMGMEAEGALQVIKAQVPQAEMFRFCGELRSITGGSGTYTMEMSHYEEVPPNIAQQVIEAYKKSREEEND